MHHNCGKDACPHRLSRYKLEDLQRMSHLPITEMSLISLQPVYEMDEDGRCVFQPSIPTPFVQIPYLLEMKSLRKVVVDLYQALTDEDVEHLRELRDKNGVSLELVQSCSRYEETLK